MFRRAPQRAIRRPGWIGVCRPGAKLPQVHPCHRAMSALDAITLSVIQAALQQTCDEMDLAFSRALEDRS